MKTPTLLALLLASASAPLTLRAQPIQFAGNRHYYQFISAPSISWHNARAAAEASFFQGVQGHLLTILTEEEQNFVVGTVMHGLTVRSWLGATDEVSPQDWRWTTGELFWLGLADGASQNGLYENWGDGNPDNGGGIEHYAAILPPSGDPYSTPDNPLSGIWVDIPDVPSPIFWVHNIGGYIVEYDTAVDRDGDGVADDIDACPDSDLRPTIFIGDIDTGVENELLVDGCTLADIIAETLTGDPSSADVVSVLLELKSQGLITGREMGEILRAVNSP